METRGIRPGNEQQSVKLNKMNNAFYHQNRNEVLQRLRGTPSPSIMEESVSLLPGGEEIIQESVSVPVMRENLPKIEFTRDIPQISSNTVYGCSNLNDLKSSALPEHVKIFIQFFLLKGTCSIGYLKKNMRRVQYDGLHFIFIKEDVNPLVGTQNIKIPYKWMELISRYLPYLSANQIFLLTEEKIISTINIYLQIESTKIKKMNRNITQRINNLNPIQQKVNIFRPEAVSGLRTKVIIISPLMLLYYVCIIFNTDIQSDIEKYLTKKGDNILKTTYQSYILNNSQNMSLEERIMTAMNIYKDICLEVYGNQIQRLSGGKKVKRKRLVDCTVKELKEKMKKKGKKLSKDGVPFTKSQMLRVLKK